MKFEFDRTKSVANKQKHGIDFIEAQKLWDDSNYLEIPAKSQDEKRFAVIGKIDVKLWTGIITYRGEVVRIISVRRARKEEGLLYES